MLLLKKAKKVMPGLIRSLSLHNPGLPRLNSKNLLFILAAFLVTGWSADYNEKGWSTLRWANKSTSSNALYGNSMKLKVEEIMGIFQKAGPLNPPTGLAISPRAEFIKKKESPGTKVNYESVRLQLPMRFPSNAAQPSAGVIIWLNEPLNLLGTPVLNDEEGDIYLLPPLIGKKGGQAFYSRAAHPPGYVETFPSRDEFPLWGNELEPFLRSLVRPTFGLYTPSVTTILSSGNRNFWKPVSQERWITAMIVKAQEALDEFQAGVNAANEMNITQQQITQMRDFLKNFRDLFEEESIIERHIKGVENASEFHAYMVNVNPAEAEKYYIKNIENSDIQLEEALAAAKTHLPEIEKYERNLMQALLTRDATWTEADDFIKAGNWDRLEDLGRDLKIEKLVYYADAGRAIEKLRNELASLSPAQRREPAWGFEIPKWHNLGPYRQVVAVQFEAERPSGLVAPGTKGARALVCIDEGFFASIESDAAVRVMAVEWWEELDARYRSPGGMFYNERRVTMLDDLWNSLNWSALKAALN